MKSKCCNAEIKYELEEQPYYAYCSKCKEGLNENDPTPPTTTVEDYEAIGREVVRKFLYYRHDAVEFEIGKHITHLIQEAELRGRIDERNQVALDNYRGQTFSDSTNWQGKFDKFIRNNEKRLSQLKGGKE